MNGDKNNPRHLLETGFGENLPSAQLHPTQQDQKLYWASEAIARFTPYQSAKYAPVLTFLFWFSCLTLITLGLVWFYLDVTFFLLSVI